MEDISPEKVQLDKVLQTLKENGLDPSATAEEVLCHLWCLYQRSENSLCSTTQDLHQLQKQQAEEMKDVERYVDHIRMLTEEREIPTSDFEKENEQLKAQLEQLRLRYDAELKEVTEMLDQEGLAEIAHSSPNEQIAYLLVERATLFEKLEHSEEKLDSHFGSLREAQLKNELVQIQHTLEEQLQQQQESLQETKETLMRNSWKKLFGIYKDNTSAEPSMHDEEFAKEKKLREFVERDLDEASQRLKMAHAEIRRLTDELDLKKREHDTLDSRELQKAKEHNNRLDKEILALRNRVRSLDSERKEYIELIEKLNKSLNDCQMGKQEAITPSTAEVTGRLQNGKMGSSVKHNILDSNQETGSHHDETPHQGCQVQITERDCRNNDLLHKLKKLQHQYDELVERNEELESILGETQNQRKEETERFECEKEGLQRKILDLEGKFSQLQMSTEKQSNRAQVVANKDKKASDFQQVFKSHEENIEILESRLAAEREWRQQLESDLEAAQKTLREQREKSELCREYNALNHFIAKANISHEVSNGVSTPNGSQFEDLATKSGKVEEIFDGLEKEKHHMSLALSESKSKLDMLQRQLYESMVEKEKLFNENVKLCHDIKNTRHELQSKKEETVQLRQELTTLKKQLLKSRSSDSATESGVLQGQPKDALLQQKQEEVRQLRQDLHRAQTLCIAAEKEMRHGRGKNLDLQKHSNLLQQENTTMKGELKQVQEKLSDTSKLCSSIRADLEQSHQKIKELEVDMLKQHQTSKTQNTLQEKLAQAKSKGSDAEKKVQELDQQLKDSHRQLRLTEARILREQQFEEEAKESRENEKKLKRQLEDEQLKRKLSDQMVEELQQQMKSLRDRVTSLAKTNTELQFQIQQQESKLRIIDDDHQTTFSEHLECHGNTQKLSEQLSLVQQEKERLYMEYDHVHKQLDEYIRKYNERQLRHKAKLRRAKEMHVQETYQCHLRIKQLVSEIALIRSQAEKEQVWIRKATTENDTLLQEKGQLLMQMNEHEETDRSNKWIISSLQSRLHLVEDENKQLQESVFRLTSQIAALERELKNVVPLDSLRLTGSSFSLPNVSSLEVGLSDCIGSLRAIQDAKSEEQPAA